MAVSKVWTCDLCNQSWSRAEIVRLAIRTSPDDRPEDADNVDVGPCCQDKPIKDAIAVAVFARQMVTNG